MQNALSVLNHEQLHAGTLEAAKTEKNATLKLLEYLSEVDRRRLYAIRGYSSLWLYVHQALNYSESQASERISAMRLMVRLPEVHEEIESNRLTLTAAAKLATHVRRERSDDAQTIELLSAIQGKSTREIDRVLASQASEPVRIESIRPISAEMTRIMMDVDQDFLQLLNQVRELQGHFGSSTCELIQAAMKGFVKMHPKNSGVSFKSHTHTDSIKNNSDSISKLRAPEVVQNKTAVVKASQNKTAVVKASQNKIPQKFSAGHSPFNDQIQSSKPSLNRDQIQSHINDEFYLSKSSFNSEQIQSSNLSGFTDRQYAQLNRSRKIPISIQRTVRSRSGNQCEFIDPQTMRRCECRVGLELDHRVPFMMGGLHTVENLRHLCRAHNQLAAIRYYGFSHMKPFLKN